MILKGIQEIPVRDEYDRARARALNAYRSGRMSLKEQVRYALAGAGIDPAAKVERDKEVEVAVNYIRQTVTGELVTGQIILRYKRKDGHQTVVEVRSGGGVRERTTFDGITLYDEVPSWSDVRGRVGAVVPRLVLAGIEFSGFPTGMTPRVVYNHFVEVVGKENESGICPVFVEKDEIPFLIGETLKIEVER